MTNSRLGSSQRQTCSSSLVMACPVSSRLVIVLWWTRNLPLSSKSRKNRTPFHSSDLKLPCRIRNINTGFKSNQSSDRPQELFMLTDSVPKNMFTWLCVTYSTLEQIQLTDWFHKLKATGLNISETTSNSLLLSITKMLRNTLFN